MLSMQRSAIRERLETLAARAELSGLGEYLLGLNNSNFRVASVLLADEVLVRLRGEDFWRVFAYLSLLSPKAFLGTCLKAAARLYRSGQVSVRSGNLAAYASFLTRNGMEIDRMKFFRAMLGLVEREEDFAEIWRTFGVNKPESRIDSLLKYCSTVVAYYEVFKECKRAQDNRDFLKRVCYALIKKGDNLSFNLASILQSYFDLQGLGARFSLRVEPYKLSYIEASLQNFGKVITSL